MAEFVIVSITLVVGLFVAIVVHRRNGNRSLRRLPAGAEVVSSSGRRPAVATRPPLLGRILPAWKHQKRGQPVKLPKTSIAEQPRRLKLSDNGPPLAEPRLTVPVTLAGAQYNSVYHGTADNRLAVRIATLRGHSHNYENTPGQDVAGATWNKRRQSLFALVADGIGSKPDSGEVAHDLAEMLLEHAAKLPSSSDPGLLISTVADHMAGQNVDGASTVVLAELARGRDGLRATVWGIGDSEAWYMFGGRWEPLHQEPSGDAENATRGVPGHRDAMVNASLIRHRGVFVLATDGFARALRGRPSPLALALVEEWREPPSPTDFMAQVDFVHPFFNDDRAVVAVWIR